MVSGQHHNEGLPDSHLQSEFFAECDDYLRVIRDVLLTLEPQPEGTSLDRERVDELFRSFHSLKGIAGMVGLQAVGQLAHQVEALLQTLRSDQATMTGELFDALLTSAQALEQLLAAQRAGSTPPDVGPLLAHLSALVGETRPAEAPPGDEPPARADGERRQLEEAQRRGDSIWRITFAPSPALAERGVNVNQVRARLQSLGALLRVTPQVAGSGGLTFEFILAGHLDHGALAQLAEDGIRTAPFEELPRGPAPEPPAPEPLAPKARPATAGPATTTLRVDLGRLDDLLQLVGELTVTRAQLARQLSLLEPLIPRSEWRALQETSQTLARRLRDIRAGVVRVRMVPIGEAFARLRFAVYDLARELGKPTTVALQGQGTEIDKHVLEGIVDPLMHLVRNAVSHGIEPREARLASGKSATATITLAAAAVGDTVVIEVEDDGQGIDTTAVLARARELSLAGDGALGPDALLDILCAPGFSTRQEADLVSGRGVGLDVVRTAVHDLNGTMTLRTAPGRGTSFRITLPPSMVVMEALLAVVGSQTFAVPLAQVREIVEIDQQRVTALEEREIMMHRGQVLPLLRLARRFRLDEPAQAQRYAFVVGGADAHDHAVGLVVDRLLGKREVVVRPISDVLGRSTGIGGAAEIGESRPALIIDVQGLLGRAL